MDHRNAALLRHSDQAFRPAATLWRGLTQARLNQAFLFEAVESRVKGARRRFAASASGDFSENSHSISVFAEPEDCQQYNLLELAQRRH